MILEIKETTVEVKFSIGTFAQIAEYKKRYEPELNMSLGKYMTLISDHNYQLDAVIDIIYYPHVMERKAKGLLPKFTYADVFEFVATNQKALEDIGEELQNSMPSDTKETKKKAVKKTD